MLLSRYIGICADQASDDEPHSCLFSAHANDFINGGAAWQINNWIPKPAYYQSSFYSSKNTAHFVSPGVPAGVSVSTHDVPWSEAPGSRLLGPHHSQHLAPARVKLLARLPFLVGGPTGVQLLLSEGGMFDIWQWCSMMILTLAWIHRPFHPSWSQSRDPLGSCILVFWPGVKWFTTPPTMEITPVLLLLRAQKQPILS